MDKFITSIWYEKDVNVVNAFYESIFDEYELLLKQLLHEGESYESTVIYFKLQNLKIMIMGNGPFKLYENTGLFYGMDKNEMSSFDKLSLIFAKLSDGGNIIVPFAKYGERTFGKVRDKFNLTWHLGLTNENIVKPFVMYQNQLDDYMSIYKDTFKDLKVIERIELNDQIQKLEFNLFGFSILSCEIGGDLPFTEAFSFMVICDNQKEIDYYWKLSAFPENEACGWLKDAAGLSWQIVPRLLHDATMRNDLNSLNKMFTEIFQMKKLNIKSLEKTLK